MQTKAMTHHLLRYKQKRSPFGLELALDGSLTYRPQVIAYKTNDEWAIQLLFLDSVLTITFCESNRQSNFLHVNYGRIPTRSGKSPTRSSRFAQMG